MLQRVHKDKISIVKNTMLEGMATDHWLDFLDVVVMWCLEYPRSTIVDELHKVMPHTIDAWCLWCQQQAGEFVEDKIVLSNIKDSIHAERTQSNQAKPRGIFMKKPAMFAKRPACKKPASSEFALQRPASAKGKKQARAVLRPHRLRNKIVLQLDETLVKGSHKKSRLAKAARPKPDQVWVCGAVVEDHPDMFFFRVLDHAADAYNRKPRSKEEMQKCLTAIGLDRDMILVTDKW